VHNVGAGQCTKWRGDACIEARRGIVRVQGCFYGGWRLLWVQPVGLLAIIAWTVTITSIYWIIAKRFFTIRIPSQAEQVSVECIQSRRFNVRSLR
jgi:ammonia channel protein AmtB